MSWRRGVGTCHARCHAASARPKLPAARLRPLAGVVGMPLPRLPPLPLHARTHVRAHACAINQQTQAGWAHLEVVGLQAKCGGVGGGAVGHAGPQLPVRVHLQDLAHVGVPPPAWGLVQGGMDAEAAGPLTATTTVGAAPRGGTACRQAASNGRRAWRVCQLAARSAPTCCSCQTAQRSSSRRGRAGQRRARRRRPCRPTRSAAAWRPAR